MSAILTILLIILIVAAAVVVLGLTGWGLQFVARIFAFLLQGFGLGLGCIIKIIIVVAIILGLCGVFS